MHALIVGLWRNLETTLPETARQMRERRAALLAEVEKLDAGLALVERTMAAAAIADGTHALHLMDGTAAREDAA